MDADLSSSTFMMSRNTSSMLFCPSICVAHRRTSLWGWARCAINHYGCRHANLLVLCLARWDHQQPIGKKCAWWFGFLPCSPLASAKETNKLNCGLQTFKRMVQLTWHAGHLRKSHIPPPHHLVPFTFVKGCYGKHTRRAGCWKTIWWKVSQWVGCGVSVPFTLSKNRPPYFYFRKLT